MSRDSDTDRFLKEASPFLSKSGRVVARAGIHFWRWGSAAVLSYIALKLQSGVEGVSKADLQQIMATHEARCEQVILDSREQIRELNRRMDLLLRGRLNPPSRGAEGLLKDNKP